jgi:hypothetical protein
MTNSAQPMCQNCGHTGNSHTPIMKSLEDLGTRVVEYHPVGYGECNEENYDCERFR